MACFADINVSQSRVATYARCGEIFIVLLTANLQKESSSEMFFTSVKIWQHYGHECGSDFLAHPVYACLMPFRRYNVKGKRGRFNHETIGCHGNVP